MNGLSRWSLAGRAVLLAGLLSVLSMGCTKVALGDPEKSVVDPGLAGWWLQQDAKNAEPPMAVAVQVYDGKTLLAAFTKPGPGYEPSTEFICKAWLTPVGDAKFACLQVFSFDTSKIEKGDFDYMIARIEQKGDDLSIRGVNDKFVKAADPKTEPEMRALITANVNKDELYGDRLAFKRMTLSDVKAAWAAWTPEDAGKEGKPGK